MCNLRLRTRQNRNFHRLNLLRHRNCKRPDTYSPILRCHLHCHWDRNFHPLRALRSWLQSSISSTIHSLSDSSLPAELVQSPPFPVMTSDLRTRVWLAVALETPATSQPVPGSPCQSPMMSKTMKFSGEPVTSAKPSSPLDKLP